MKHALTLVARGAAVLSCMLLGVAARPADKLEVVATIPDLADIVREIGGDRVDVTTIARGGENLHHVQTKPSHLIAMSRADVFIQVGLSLETAFVPGLLESSRNERIQPGAKGFVNVSAGFAARDLPESVERKHGDVHPDGNPHMNLDPRAGALMASRILAGLAAVDPAHAAEYVRRHADYAARLEKAGARWSELGKAWSGRKIIVYHKEYDYLADAYGLVVLGAIEAKPGIPPTPNSLSTLVNKAKEERGVVILTASWSNRREVAEVASRVGAKVVELPNQCGGMRGAETWIGMMDLIHTRLDAAFKEPPEAR